MESSESETTHIIIGCQAESCNPWDGNLILAIEFASNTMRMSSTLGT